MMIESFECRAIRLLTGAALALVVASAQAAPPAQIPVQILDPNNVCARWDVGGTPSAPTLTCVAGTPPPPGAPVCTPSAITTPSTLTSAGGSVALGSNCQPSTGVTYTWTRSLPSSASLGSAATASDPNLASNSSASAVTYRYQVVACIGAACDTKTIDVNVPSGSAPPPGGTISCTTTGRTVVVDMPWVSTDTSTRLHSGSFGQNDILVVRFTPPAGSQSYQAGSITMAEWGGGPVPRSAVLSSTACDFNTSSWLTLFNASQGSPTINMSLQVGGAQSPWVTLVQPGTVYYLNIKNYDRAGNPTCTSQLSCEMYVDFTKPPGT